MSPVRDRITPKILELWCERKITIKQAGELLGVSGRYARKLLGPRPPATIIGKKFGDLTVLRKSPLRYKNRPTYICECDCGNDFHTTVGDLTRKHYAKTHCGCKRKIGSQLVS